jgi:hypothetical protein
VNASCAHGAKTGLAYFGIGNPAPWNSHLRKGEMRLLILAFLCAAWWPKVAQANDRPFLLTTHAVAEEDDDEVWSVETWWQRAGPVQAFTIAPEYAFNPTTSMQFQASRATGRANALEIEFKHLFNHIGRDGWGWGIELSGEVAGTGSDWKHHGVALKLPYTLQLPGGDALLHLNAGLQKQRGERREWVGSAAFEHKLPWRNTGFIELGREDRQTLWHAGVRHWVRRDKLALDVGVQRQSSDYGRDVGAVVGIAWYDL